MHLYNRGQIFSLIVFLVRATRAIARCCIKIVNFCLVLVDFGVFWSGWGSEISVFLPLGFQILVFVYLLGMLYPNL